MNEFETSLRRRLHRYLETTGPTEGSGVMGVCITGSLAAGFVDEYSDIDLTVVLEGDGTDVDPERLSDTLLPRSATVQRRVPLEKYSFDWNDGHIDLDVVPYTELRASDWEMETRWEYDNAEIVSDTSGRLESRLTSEVAFADGERAELIQQYAEEFLFVAQWDVHKACLRESFRTAHRAATQAVDNALGLLYLLAGEFIPRDKWITPGLEMLPQADEEIQTLAWEATRVVERDLADVHRRVRTLHSLWNRLKPSLVEADLVDPESLSWEAPPDELCLVD